MEDLIGISFIMDKQDDGQQFRAWIVNIIEDHDAQLENNKDQVKVLLSLNDNTRE
jgi:ABC-type Fe3+-hydroxamate transport system substrate-binding protein